MSLARCCASESCVCDSRLYRAEETRGRGTRRAVPTPPPPRPERFRDRPRLLSSPRSLLVSCALVHCRYGLLSGLYRRRLVPFVNSSSRANRRQAAMTEANGQHARRRSPGRSPYSRQNRRPRSAASSSSSSSVRSISPSSFVLAPSSPIPGSSTSPHHARYHSTMAAMDVSPAGPAAPVAAAPASAPMVTLYSTSPAPATPGARSAIVSDPVHPNSLVPRRLHSQELCDFIKARPTADLFRASTSARPALTTQITSPPRRPRSSSARPGRRADSSRRRPRRPRTTATR